jgi:hypothetical protein
MIAFELPDEAVEAIAQRAAQIVLAQIAVKPPDPDPAPGSHGSGRFPSGSGNEVQGELFGGRTVDELEAIAASYPEGRFDYEGAGA